MKDLDVKSSDKVQDVRGAVSEIANLAKSRAFADYKKFILDKSFILDCLEFFKKITGVTYSDLEKEHIFFWLIEE